MGSYLANSYKKSIALFCVESDYEPELDPGEPDLVPPLPPALPTQALRERLRDIQNIFTVHRETLTQYITGERGVCTLVLCSIATVTSCMDASVRIVT